MTCTSNNFLNEYVKYGPYRLPLIVYRITFLPTINSLTPKLCYKIIVESRLYKKNCLTHST